MDLHNKKRMKIANGLEKRGDPGPQPPAANMMELVSKIIKMKYKFSHFILYKTTIILA